MLSPAKLLKEAKSKITDNGDEVFQPCSYIAKIKLLALGRFNLFFITIVDKICGPAYDPDEFGAVFIKGMPREFYEFKQNVEPYRRCKKYTGQNEGQVRRLKYQFSKPYQVGYRPKNVQPEENKLVNM